MAPRTILVVEDDAAIRRGIRDALCFEGYEVLEAGDGEVAVDKAVNLAVDLVLLDLVMPRRHGLDVLALVRERRPQLPVIVLTAMGGEPDRVRGLRLGADDYVVKPFSVAELLARVEAVLRRSAERPEPVALVAVADGVVDVPRSEVRFTDGARAELSERERDLLSYLAQNAGRAISRDELLERIWRVDPSRFETRTVDICVARLRAKLRDDPQNPRTLFTVRGKGYMFRAREPESP